MSGEHKIRPDWKLSVAVVVAVALLAGFLGWELKSSTLVARARSEEHTSELQSP